MGNRNGKRGILCAALAVALLSAVSCVKLTPEEAEERAGQQFFTMFFRATNDLNCFQDEPASLSLCLYQLTDRRAFDALRDNPDGFLTLLSCEKFDESVVGRERLFANPGGKSTVELERRRGVRYVAIAAGYHASNIADSTLLIELPAVTVKSGKRPPPRVGVVLERGRMLRDRSVR